jgi:hypothetical protein
VTTAITTLETIHCWCGVPMALPADAIRNARQTGNDLWCPTTGHRMSFDSENDRLRKQLDRERARVTAVTDQLRAAERQTAAVKGQLTKTRKRAAAGVCPCCKRSFVQLTRHIATKHPDYDPAVTS